jgi:hypothetical protein
MPLFTIIHIFEIPARNQYEATDQLLEARGTKEEKIFLVKTIIRERGTQPEQSITINNRQPAKWGTIFKRQLTGKW